MNALSLDAKEDEASTRWAGQHGIARWVTLVVVLLALGAVAPPALGNSGWPGQLYAFGRNYYGQLGNEVNLNGEPNPTPMPIQLPGERGPVTQAAVGAGFSLVITSSGQLYTFGRNYYGELGDEANVGVLVAANPTPTLVTLPGATGPASQAAAGMGHSLVDTTTGQLYSFGYNWFGQLGNTTNNQSENPNPTPTLVTLPGASGTVAQIAAGGFHSLVVTSTGELYAFGDDNAGQLGTTTKETASANPTPTAVTLPGATGPVTQVAAGEFFSLAVTSTGQLYAFGENRLGELGNKTNNETERPNPTPTLVTLPGATGPITQVAAGNDHSLALTTTGQLYAFGENRFGELGNKTNNETERPNPTPTLVTLPGATGPITRIAAGDGYSLALTSTGQLYAFGCDYSGELGIPPGARRDAPHPTPTLVELPGDASINTIATGPWSDHTLVVSQLGVADSSLAMGEIGVPYSAIVQGTGGGTPDTWAATELPPGLSINQTNGTISGTPTTTGSYTPTITLTDTFGIEATLPVTIPITTPPSVQSETLPAGMVSVPYSATVQGINGVTPYTWAATGLPPGLSINQTDGTISGTPTTTGSYTPTITLTDRYGTESSIPLTIPITRPPSPPNKTPPPSETEQTTPPAAPRPAANAVSLVPSIDDAHQSATKWRERNPLANVSHAKTPIGTEFSFSLNEQATVNFSFILIRPTGSHSCLSTQEHEDHRCSTVTAATLSFLGHSGTNNVAFAGRLSRTHTLKPGQYELHITATNAAGQHSTSVSLRFMIMHE